MTLTLWTAALLPGLVLSANIIALQNEAELFLNHCISGWTFHDEVLELPITFTRNRSGVYSCGDPLADVAVIYLEKPFKFERTDGGSRDITEDGEVELTCSVEFLSNDFEINNSLVIRNELDAVLATKSETVGTNIEARLKVNTSVPVVRGEGKTLQCSWHISYLYTPPIDDTISKIFTFGSREPMVGLYADLSKLSRGMVECKSDETPPPLVYSWTCNSTKSMFNNTNSGWVSVGSMLYFSKADNFSCLCRANVKINGNVVQKSWRGYINFEGFGRTFSTYLILISILAVHLSGFCMYCAWQCNTA